MKKSYLLIAAIILTGIFLLSGIGIAYAAEKPAEVISPSVVTVAFAHSYNGTTNVQGAAFNLKGANAEIDLEGGVAFCFDTNLEHMPQGSEYQFLGLAQDYSGTWNVENAYKCILAAEDIINQSKYRELSGSMKLFAVQVAVRKQQAFGPYSGVQATASADVVCNARQSQLMIELTNEIVREGLAGNRKLPSKVQTIELEKTGGSRYDGDCYILAEYSVRTPAGSAQTVTLGEGTSQGVEAAVDGNGKITVRIPCDRMQGTVSWSLAVMGTVQVKTMLLFSPATSGYQRMVSLRSYGAEARGAVSGSETFYGLTIRKKNGETGDILADGQAVFRIKSEATGRYMAVNGSTEFITASGTVTVPEILPAGTYLLEETAAPQGYKVGDAVRVSIPETSSVDVSNSPLKGRIAVIKTGNSYTGVEIQQSEYGEIRRPVFVEKPLAGVKFTIRDSSGATVDELLTDADGRALSDELPWGKYYVQEAETLPGYILETKVYEAEITPEKLDPSVKVYNDYREVSLIIQKQIETWTPVENGNTVSRETEFVPGEGIVFGLYRTEDDSLAAVGVTDASGRLEFHTRLPLGLYYVRELRGKEGYLLDDTRYGVDFTSRTEILLQIDNYLEVYPVSVSKKDITGENPLPGSVIEIYDGAEQLLYREVTGEDGLLPGIRLAPGTYSLQEIIAPDGYAVHTSRIRFTVNSDGSITGDAEVRDEPVRFLGIKYDTYGTPLPGAEFTLFDREGTPVETAVSDEKGEFMFQGFPEGKYIIRETKAPEGYYLSEDTFSFENDGRWVNGDFYTEHAWTDDRIPEPEPIPTPVPASPAPTPTPAPQKTEKIPDTGESGNYLLFAITASLAIMGIISVVVVMGKEE